MIVEFGFGFFGCCGWVLICFVGGVDLFCWWIFGFGFWFLGGFGLVGLGFGLYLGVFVS